VQTVSAPGRISAVRVVNSPDDVAVELIVVLAVDPDPQGVCRSAGQPGHPASAGG
jgi:hypothetical protein